MDTYYYYLIGALLFAFFMEFSALASKTEGANMFAWFIFHGFAIVASFIHAIYIFFIENLSAAGYALLYSLGYIIIEGLISILILSLLADKVFNKKE